MPGIEPGILQYQCTILPIDHGQLYQVLVQMTVINW